MQKAARCYRLTLVLDASTSNTSNTPVEAIVQSVCQKSCYTARITYEQAALLLVRALREPTVIWEHINALLKYDLVEVMTDGDKPHLFSVQDLSENGIPLDFKRAL
jgi:hypothetical protein